MKVIAIKVVIETIDFDADVSEQLRRLLRVLPRRLQRLAASIPDQFLTIYLELVALGVTAEVIVIVYDEDFFVGTLLLQVEIRCGEPGNTATNNNKVIGSIGLLIRVAELRACHCYSMRNLERTRMTTTQAGQ